jgi:large subunit ribosomal protein L4
VRSPIWRGGATTFGPQPRDYAPQVPKKIRRLAIRSALNARAQDGDVVVVEPFGFDAPKTSQLAGWLAKVEAEGNVLVLTDGLQREVHLSARNIPGVLVRPWGEASAYDVLWADLVVVEETALQSAEEDE